MILILLSPLLPEPTPETLVCSYSKFSSLKDELMNIWIHIIVPVWVVGMKLHPSICFLISWSFGDYCSFILLFLTPHSQFWCLQHHIPWDHPEEFCSLGSHRKNNPWDVCPKPRVRKWWWCPLVGIQRPWSILVAPGDTMVALQCQVGLDDS